MRSSFLLPLAFALPLMLAAQTTPSTTTLAQLRDRSRALLLFASRPDDPSLLAQLTRLKEAAPALAERDVVVLAVPYNDPSPTAPSLSAADALAARRQFHVAPADFTVILLGKDGGEKYRSQKPVSLQKLRDTIDAMPMRKREMKGATP